MIPRTLNEWTIPVILELLRKRVSETEDFDFKQALPHSKDKEGKNRLCRACCAFANANGGFLVFGVVDDRSWAPRKRLVGLDIKLDFPEHFGSYPQNCSPSVDWSFRLTPLVVRKQSVIHVVHIQRSWKAPHAAGNAKDGWRFTKRTNKGTEDMSIEEVRGAFLGFYEKRLRLQLLKAELRNLQQTAHDMVEVCSPPDTTSYSLVSFDVTVIESILADTYPITVSKPLFIETIARLRQEVIIANNKFNAFILHAGIAMTNTKERVRSHNDFMRRKAFSIRGLCTTALDALDQILEPAVTRAEGVTDGS